MESVEILDGLSIGCGRGNFRSVTAPCIVLGKLLHFSQTSYGTATGKGKYGVYLRGLLECRENHSLICLKSGNSSEKEVFKQVEGEESLAGDPRVLTDVQFP